MNEVDDRVLKKRNLWSHALILGKLLVIIAIPFLFQLYLAPESFQSFRVLVSPLMGPSLILLGLFVWNLRGYWKIMEVPPVGHFHEMIQSTYSLDEIADILPSIFKFKKYEEGAEGLKILTYAAGITWTDYVQVVPVSVSEGRYCYRIESKLAGALKALNLRMDGGRNFHNVQRLKRAISN